MNTYAESREAFLSQLVRSPHTVQSYRRAITLFIGDDPNITKPFSPVPLTQLGRRDQAILVRFTQWLLGEHGLAPASAKLYMSAIKRWFEWMEINDLLPDVFPLAKALWALSDALAGRMFAVDRRPPEPPEGIDRIIAYYDSATVPAKLQYNPDPDRIHRWALEMYRNRALLRCLAESGGRISEILSLKVGDFPPQAFKTSEVWRVPVVGKGGHRYKLRFMNALSYIERYLAARQISKTLDDTEPIFVAHSTRYDGQPLSRYSAWKIVDEARRASGLGKIHPHDFRHWCASNLVNSGVPIDVVQEYLGHRSVETTRAYYAHTKEARIDEAIQQLKMPQSS